MHVVKKKNKICLLTKIDSSVLAMCFAGRQDVLQRALILQFYKEYYA